MGAVMRIVGGMTLLAIGYGIAHDLVTAHVAVTYFTVYHPHLVDSQNPIVMALLWGVIATWWFGAGAGLLIAACARFGKWPKATPQQALKATAKAMAVVYVLAMFTLAGIYGVAQLAPDKTADWHERSCLVAVGVTHWFSYTASGVAALVICARMAWIRAHMAQPAAT